MKDSTPSILNWMPYPFKMWPACHSSPLGQIKVYCGPDSYKGHFNINDNVPSSFITDYQCSLLPPYRHIATPVEDISHHLHLFLICVAVTMHSVLSSWSQFLKEAHIQWVWHMFQKFPLPYLNKSVIVLAIQYPALPCHTGSCNCSPYDAVQDANYVQKCFSSKEYWLYCKEWHNVRKEHPHSPKPQLTFQLTLFLSAFSWAWWSLVIPLNCLCSSTV